LAGPAFKQFQVPLDMRGFEGNPIHHRVEAAISEDGADFLQIADIGLQMAASRGRFRR
jgi:hypothetical protein